MEVTFQTTAKIASVCSIRPIGMTYSLLNVFVYSYGHTEIIYSLSRFLCVHLRGVLLLDEIFSIFFLCNLIFGEISEWFITSSLGSTHSNAQCHGRGQDAVSAQQRVYSTRICWGETDCKCTCQWSKHILKRKWN